MASLLLLVLASPGAFETFDGPVDASRWYVGTAAEPKGGVLTLRRGAWIVSRGIPREGLERVEIRFRGRLRVEFADPDAPLAESGEAGVAARAARGGSTLRIAKGGATLDGEPLDWEGEPTAAFRLSASGGSVAIDEVRVFPSPPAEGPMSEMERRTVFAATTPAGHREGPLRFRRASLPLWDVEVSLLLARARDATGKARRRVGTVEPLGSKQRGAPVLGAVVVPFDGAALARRAATSPLAMRDWGDEKRHLPPLQYDRYLAEEYALMGLLLQAQRALNLAIPERDDLEPLEALAMIRHARNAHAAVALAQTLGAKRALAALRRAAPREADLAAMTGDRIRRAAADAARAVLDEPPEEWPGFRFDPAMRFVTLERARELLR